MANFEPSKKQSADFNGGNKFRAGDAIQATTINNIIEGVLWSQENSNITIDSSLSDTSTNPVENKAIKGEIDKIWEKINYVKPTVAQFSLFPEPDARYKITSKDGIDCKLDYITHRETNVSAIKESGLSLKMGSITVIDGITPSSTLATVDINQPPYTVYEPEIVTFTLSGQSKQNENFSASVRVEFYYTSYIGTSESEQISDVTGFTDLNSSTVSGKKTITVPAGGAKYIWFVSDTEITDIKSDGFTVPFSKKVNITVNGIVFNTYRTDNKIVAGTYIYNIT